MTRGLHNSASLFAIEQSRAAFRVWKGSTTAEIKAPRITRREAVRLFHDARRFERQTRGFCESRYRPGKITRREGKLGRSALDVLHALLFDFRNDRTGRMDPSYASIALHACMSVATVGRALRRLKDAGVLNWIPRCKAEEGPEGGFLMRQISNLYAVIPSITWRGFKRPPDPPKPDPGSWGASPPMSAKDFGGADRVPRTFFGPLDDAIARLEARLKPPRSS